jgi:hypothetical protein
MTHWQLYVCMYMGGAGRSSWSLSAICVRAGSKGFRVAGLGFLIFPQSDPNYRPLLLLMMHRKK